MNYLTQKGIESFTLPKDIELAQKVLIIPLYDFEGKPVGSQTITPDGKKKFSKGTSTKGAMYILKAMPERAGAVDA